MESGSDKVTLSPEDGSAVDALLNGDSGEAVSPARRERVQAWLQTLDASPMPEPAGDLAARTLAAVAADMHIAAHAGAAHAGASRPVPRSRWRRRLAEFGAMAVAATLLVAVSIEGLSTARASARRVACQSNMKLFAGAFTQYANLESASPDARQLPMLAMPANGSWLRGNDEPGGVAAMNNAANLLPLVTRKLVPVKAMFCAGAGIPEGPIAVTSNQVPEIGYSYRDVESPDPPQWDGQASSIILTDKNPVFGTMIRPELAEKSSPNHGGKGTYVLRADSSVSWDLHPNIGPDHDNIWTIGTGKERLALYTGHEVPKGSKDVFVCP